MSAISQSNEIDRQAAEWAAKTEGHALSAAEQAALEVWLAADSRHVGAYAKATAVLAMVERVRATGVQPVVIRSRLSLVPSRRQVMLGGSIAASLAIFGGVGWNYFRDDVYSTKLGETKVVPLSDGSIVTLNTDSKVIVRYTQGRRDVTLVRGEILFDVAKNKVRPFVVAARDVHVRAVGTSFAVRLLADQPMQVLVREGVVELTRPAVPVAAPVAVHANGRAVVPENAPIVVVEETAAKVARELAWIAGRISFEDQTLTSASREFARYSSTRIVIDDPAVANRTVTGFFVSNDPVGFARAVAISLNLNAEVGQNEVRLLRKDH
jgi:transmembrane sensor